MLLLPTPGRHSCRHYHPCTQRLELALQRAIDSVLLSF